MRSISSFDAMEILNPPEHTDKPSLTIVTPCIEIAKLMERVMRGIAPAPPIGHDDFEMTTEEEYRNAQMSDINYVEMSDDPLVDLSNVQRNVENVRRSLSKDKPAPARVMAPAQDAAREPSSEKPSETPQKSTEMAE